MNELEEIIADAHEVFCYDREVRPQDRAHAYLARNRVRRGYNDTAMECVVVDLIRRAYNLAGGGCDDLIANVKRQFSAINQVSRAALDALEGDEE